MGERPPHQRSARKLRKAAEQLHRGDRGEEAGFFGCAVTGALWRCLLLGGLAVAVAVPALGDEFRPAYLQLREIDPAVYEVLWKVPALDEATTLRIAPMFPAGVHALSPVRSSYAAGTAVQRWRIAIDGGLAGKTIRFHDV